MSANLNHKNWGNCFPIQQHKILSNDFSGTNGGKKLQKKNKSRSSSHKFTTITEKYLSVEKKQDCCGALSSQHEETQKGERPEQARGKVGRGVVRQEIHYEHRKPAHQRRLHSTTPHKLPYILFRAVAFYGQFLDSHSDSSS